MINTLKKIVLATVAVSVISCTAKEEEHVNLRFSHFWPAVSAAHKTLFQAWADSVEKESNGRITVEVYPGATLAKPPAQYDAVKNGIADVTATVQGYTANRFPLSQIVELPGVVKNGVQGSCVLQSLYDEGYLASEYEETRPLFLFTHGRGMIHTKEKVINVPSDLAGLRIRRPTAVVGKLLEELEAAPVGMPAPESYQSLQRGVIDGVALPWEGMKAFRINELAPNHTDVGGLYSLAFVVTINKQVYDQMPEDLKKVINDNSGMTWAKKGGAMFDAVDVQGRAEAVEAGHNIVTIEGGVENPEWKPVMEKAIEGYLEELEGKGLPARKVYARTLELAQTCQ